MKNRTKMISLLMAVCMMIILLPAVAFAAGTTSVNIGTATLTASNPYYHNGTSGAQGTADNDPTGANATFDAATGTLTLNNLHIENEADGYKGIQWEYSGSGAHDLIIVLPAGTNNIVKNTKGAAINGEYGWQSEKGGGSLTITGSGNLEVVGSSYGIWVWHNVVIEDSVTVNATGTSNMGIANNNKYGKILIKDNAKVTAKGGQYGIGYDHDHANTPEIQSGTINVTGDTAAFRAHPNPLGAAVNAGTIYVNKTDPSETGADVWDKTTKFTDCKYVGITSTPVTTYTVTYHSNDGTNNTYFQTFSEGVQQNLKNNRFANTGKYFLKWSTNSDGTGTSYADKVPVKLTSDIDLYAQWGTESPSTYYINFYPGHTGSNTGSMENLHLTQGTTLYLPLNAFTREGYDFIGWDTALNTKNVKYTDGQEITLTEDLVLYAQWKDSSMGGGNTGNTGGNDNTTGGSNTGGGNTGGGNNNAAPSSTGISLWYNSGNSFGSSNSAVPLSVEIDGVSVAFSGTGSQFTVGCISPNAQWVTVRWQGASVTTNFTPDANAYCVDVVLPKTGDVSVMAFALMAVIAAAGAMGKK